MMGAGKTHWGQKLAAYFGCAHSDLDEWIEKNSQTSIAGLFALEGEEGFRKTEAAMLRECAAGEPSVISCGGGAPLFYDNMEFMRAKGCVVWLQASASTLAQRIWGQHSQRPLVSECRSPMELEAKLDGLLAQRKFVYQQAHVQANSETMALEALARLIMQHQEPPL
jgi:shikimate kinase